MEKCYVELSGGLGNQMFQYAFARMLQEKYNCEIIFDTGFYGYNSGRKVELTNYNIKPFKFLKRSNWVIWHKLLEFGIARLLLCAYKEKKVFVVGQEINTKRYRYYSGYWQNRLYFHDIKKDLIHELRYLGAFSEHEMRLAHEMKNSNSIAMHVRRGDYLNEKQRHVYEMLGDEYYYKALRIANAKLKQWDDGECLIYVFSDDIEWCKEHFSSLSKAVFIDEHRSSSKYCDFFLMQHAKCIIMANSTFSWWSAWLSDDESKIVIAPKKWYINPTDNKNLLNALIEDKWFLVD